MSRELIYTSAPRGLSPNSMGFCTVAATAGLPRQVRLALESLCSYEFSFNLSDPRSHLNPVNFAHTRLKIGGQQFSVLSRIAACGADYSGRSNKIAHHVLLDDGEQSPAGPARMLLEMGSRGLFRTAWDGEPRELPPGDLRGLARELSSSGGGRHWQQVAGHAGWAAKLPAAWRKNHNLPSLVIYEPGTELLPLFEESLEQLSSRERWEVGLATYYSQLPAGCQCHWRGLLAGSRATAETGKFPGATVLDLTAPLGSPGEEEEAMALVTPKLPPPKVTQPAAPRTVDASTYQPVSAVREPDEVRRISPATVSVERVVRLGPPPTPTWRKYALPAAAGLLLTLAIGLVMALGAANQRARSLAMERDGLLAEVARLEATAQALERSLSGPRPVRPAASSSAPTTVAPPPVSRPEVAVAVAPNDSAEPPSEETAASAAQPGPRLAIGDRAPLYQVGGEEIMTLCQAGGTERHKVFPVGQSQIMLSLPSNLNEVFRLEPTDHGVRVKVINRDNDQFRELLLCTLEGQEGAATLVCAVSDELRSEAELAKYRKYLRYLVLEVTNDGSTIYKCPWDPDLTVHKQLVFGPTGTPVADAAAIGFEIFGSTSVSIPGQAPGSKDPIEAIWKSSPRTLMVKVQANLELIKAVEKARKDLEKSKKKVAEGWKAWQLAQKKFNTAAVTQSDTKAPKFFFDLSSDMTRCQTDYRSASLAYNEQLAKTRNTLKDELVKLSEMLRSHSPVAVTDSWDRPLLEVKLASRWPEKVEELLKEFEPEKVVEAPLTSDEVKK